MLIFLVLSLKISYQATRQAACELMLFIFPVYLFNVTFLYKIHFLFKLKIKLLTKKTAHSDNTNILMFTSYNVHVQKTFTILVLVC